MRGSVKYSSAFTLYLDDPALQTTPFREAVERSPRAMEISDNYFLTSAADGDTYGIRFPGILREGITIEPAGDTPIKSDGKAIAEMAHELLKSAKLPIPEDFMAKTLAAYHKSATHFGSHDEFTNSTDWNYSDSHSFSRSVR